MAGAPNRSEITCLSWRRNSAAATLFPVIIDFEGKHPYPFLCPQCGCPTHGSLTSSGRQSSFCEDCVGDRDIDDEVAALSG